jgi:hypothetical protein
MTFTHTITIVATFGSDIQHDVSMRVIKEYLEAWRANVLAGHSRNKVTITYEEEPLTN